MYPRYSQNMRLTRLRRTMATIANQKRSGWEQMPHGEPYWQRIPRWSGIEVKDFIDYGWQTKNSVQNIRQLSDFVLPLLPNEIPQPVTRPAHDPEDEARSLPKTAAQLVKDLAMGLNQASMAVKLTPHVLSLINWSDPLNDPLFRQFVPLRSRFKPDHPKLTLDSLDETSDSPVNGLIHRYPDKAVFLASSVCPVYCRFCTRSYAVGTDTNTVNKTRFLPIQKKWEPMFNYIEKTPTLADILVSGGDSYTLSPYQLRAIGERLLDISHISRVRIASKGLAICPSRLIDRNDTWADTLIHLSQYGRKMGKSVAFHTHFNHPNEITWITQIAARRLFEEGVTVRNQTVLLNGVNNHFQTMISLIKMLSSMNIQPVCGSLPCAEIMLVYSVASTSIHVRDVAYIKTEIQYYVFQSDMVPGIEDLRTPLHEIIVLESQVRGLTAGFMTPNFMVHLAGGGGKRLACSYQSYDRSTGLATFLAPSSKSPDRKWEHWDPLFSLSSKENLS